MFSDAINSISWRCRPSSPWIAAAISGSASVSPVVKDESGAEAVLALAVLALREEELMGEYLLRRNQLQAARSVTYGGRKSALRDTTSPGNGQGLAVRAQYLCKIWWRYPWAGEPPWPY